MKLMLASVLASAAIGAAQQAPVRDNTAPRITGGTAVLSGTIVNDKTGRPLRRAIVTASSSELGLRPTIVTDDTGTFAFKELPAGRFYLSAHRSGFITASFGAKRPNRPGSPITLVEGERRTGVELRLQPGAVITGTVRNPLGQPVPGVRVIVLRSAFGYDTGERTLTQISGGFGEGTDDRGVYRIYGLPPDEYYVVVSPGIGISRSASDMREVTPQEMDWAARMLRDPGAALSPVPAPGRAVDYAPVFYPGVATQAESSSVTLKAGEERTGVDIVLGLMPTSKLTGTVVSADGALPPNLQVNVVAHDTIPGIPFSGFGSARVGGDGKFVSAGLMPGDYTITVRAGSAGRAGGPGAAASLFGLSTVSLTGGDADVTVKLESGVSVSGRLVFESDATKPPADVTKVRVSLTAMRSRVPTLGVPAATVDATGAFSFKGVTPGRYRLSAFGAAAPWQAKSAVVGGVDAMDLPVTIANSDVAGIEIAFTDKPTELSGNLLDAAGKPAPEFFIIVFPADKTFWTPQSRRIQSVRPATDGRFRVPNLPPGDYLIAAVTDVDQGEWYDPAFLAQLVEASTRVTLAEGEKKIQNLKIGR